MSRIQLNQKPKLIEGNDETHDNLNSPSVKTNLNKFPFQDIAKLL